ncbi:hypothetical protein NN561_016003 [Cricetulus griseus]
MLYLISKIYSKHYGNVSVPSGRLMRAGPTRWGAGSRTPSPFPLLSLEGRRGPRKALGPQGTHSRQGSRTRSRTPGLGSATDAGTEDQTRKRGEQQTREGRGDISPKMSAVHGTDWATVTRATSLVQGLGEKFVPGGKSERPSCLGASPVACGERSELGHLERPLRQRTREKADSVDSTAVSGHGVKGRWAPALAEIAPLSQEGPLLSQQGAASR